MGTYISMRAVTRHHSEDDSVDRENPYTEVMNNQGNGQLGRDDFLEHHKHMIAPPVYESIVKPSLDHLLSFVGLIVLSPLMGAIALAVVIDDPGSIFFTQKRVGKDGKYFMLHKYRSMKMSTPHDVPTHMLSHPEQYITRVGKILRKTSLDELPQIWDIFRGKMSIIGPRPALWNQKDLIEERSKYGANAIFPGLTGLAQIQGRDELEISDKAALDGKYVKILKQGGIKAFIFDAKMFCLTITSVLRRDGVVEGGTGSLSMSSNSFQNTGMKDVSVPKAAGAGTEEYGHLKTFHIDKERKIRILITGSGSYIGESFEKYVHEYYSNIETDTIDMESGIWRDYDFSKYDTVFHVAGIAHADVGSVKMEQQKKYYEVNTDLAIETAKKSKAAGVSQFIFMSSMIVYGDSASYGKEKIIDEYTIPAPANFYGDSKWRGDVGVRELADDNFAVAVLRPPMIYGKGSKGNYSTLAKLAKYLSVFPNVSNRRSMLHIENLCEFVSLLALSGEGGIYFPQNSTYTNTTEMVCLIGAQAHRPIKTVGLLNPAVALASHVPGKIGELVKKAFGNNVYDQRISQYKGLDYQKVGLEESIQRAEGADTVINFTDCHNRAADKKGIKISIITICFNSESTIRRTIESVINQRYRGSVEYLIIDGASKDRTVEIAESYRPLFEEKGYNYIISSEPDKGIYDAMNKGIRKSTGNMIGIINSGDWYEKDAISTVAAKYEREPFDYFYADVRLIKGNGKSIVKHSKHDRIVTSRHWNHPSSFVTRETYEELGLYRCEGIHDDFEFLLRAKKAGKKISIVNRILANFMTGGASNEKNPRKSVERIRDRYKGYRVNGYSPLYFIECVGIEAAKAIISG